MVCRTVIPLMAPRKLIPSRLGDPLVPGVLILPRVQKQRPPILPMLHMSGHPLALAQTWPSPCRLRASVRSFESSAKCFSVNSCGIQLFFFFQEVKCRGKLPKIQNVVRMGRPMRMICSILALAVLWWALPILCVASIRNLQCFVLLLHAWDMATDLSILLVPWISFWVEVTSPSTVRRTVKALLAQRKLIPSRLGDPLVPGALIRPRAQKQRLNPLLASAWITRSLYRPSNSVPHMSHIDILQGSSLHQQFPFLMRIGGELGDCRYHMWLKRRNVRGQYCVYFDMLSHGGQYIYFALPWFVISSFVLPSPAWDMVTDLSNHSC